MEGAGHPHNQPLLATQLAAEGFNRGDVVIAPLFLSPGRHAGPSGDLAQIAQAASSAAEKSPAGVDASPALRCHFTDLVGSHPLAVETLAANLRATIASLARRNQS
jgi:sirohydrochlorin ferrochelatase